MAPPPVVTHSVLSLAALHGSGMDLAHAFAAHLGWRELLSLGRVNKFYQVKLVHQNSPEQNFLFVLPGHKTCSCCLQEICASDALWEPQCAAFWADKVFVPAKCKNLVASGQHRKAFSEAIRDSGRTWITAEELCGLEWHGRMKEAAGEHFTDTDPWWTGDGSKPASRFHMDGTTTRGTTTRPGDPPAQTQSGEWRFVRTTCGRTGPVGSFIRMKHRGLGRETPTKIVYRHSNWGWVLDGCWSVSASFPLPPKGQDASMEDDALQVTVETQQEEAMAYNYGLPMPDERVEGGAAGGEEGGAGGSDDNESLMVTVNLNGREISIPVHALFELVRQNQVDPADSEDDDDYAMSVASSPSEDDQQDDGGGDSGRGSGLNSGTAWNS